MTMMMMMMMMMMMVMIMMKRKYCKGEIRIEVHTGFKSGIFILVLSIRPFVRNSFPFLIDSAITWRILFAA
jgi:hypothetical protein